MSTSPPDMNDCSFNYNSRRNKGPFQGTIQDYNTWQKTSNLWSRFEIGIYLSICVALFTVFVYECMFITTTKVETEEVNTTNSFFLSSFLYNQVSIIICLFYLLYIGLFRQWSSVHNFKAIPHQFLFFACLVTLVLCVLVSTSRMIDRVQNKETGMFKFLCVLFSIEIFVLVGFIFTTIYKLLFGKLTLESYKYRPWRFIMKKNLYESNHYIVKKFSLLSMLALSFLCLMTAFGIICFTVLNDVKFDDFYADICILIPILSSLCGFFAVGVTIKRLFDLSFDLSSSSSTSLVVATGVATGEGPSHTVNNIN